MQIEEEGVILPDLHNSSIIRKPNSIVFLLLFIQNIATHVGVEFANPSLIPWLLQDFSVSLLKVRFKNQAPSLRGKIFRIVGVNN